MNGLPCVEADMFKKIWFTAKRLFKPTVIVLFFWITIFSIVFIPRYYAVDKETIKLRRQIDVLKTEAKTIEDNVVLNSIFKLQPKIDIGIAKKITASIIKNCAEKELSPYLVICLIYVESSFNQMSTSTKSAIGLMQVHWKSWKGHVICADVKTISDLYQIDINIDCGTSILKKLIVKGGSIRKGLDSYYGKYSEEYHDKMASALYRIMF